MNPSSCTEPLASVLTEKKYVKHNSTSASRQNGNEPTAAADARQESQIGILKTGIQESDGTTVDDDGDGWTMKCSKKNKQRAKVTFEDLRMMKVPQKEVRRALQEQGGRSSPENSKFIKSLQALEIKLSLIHI